MSSIVIAEMVRPLANSDEEAKTIAEVVAESMGIPEQPALFPQAAA